MKLWKWLIFLLVVSCSNDSGVNLTNVRSGDKLFLPAISYEYAIKKSMCIAWMSSHPGYPSADLTTLDADCYYHWGWWHNLDNYLASGGVPHLWCNSNKTGSINFYQIAADHLTNYQGIVLLFNEPNLPDQCDLTPEQLALSFYIYEQILPDAQLVGPNFFFDRFITKRVQYVDDFITSYQALKGTKPQPDMWAIHFYNSDESILDELNAFCTLLRKHMYKCHKIMVTEYGTDDPVKMLNWTREMIEDNRVLMYMPFTNRNYAKYAMITTDGKLTNIGKALIEARE
jgi:hypothetical protein